MDFNDTKDEAAFRIEARDFLAKHLKLKGEEPARLNACRGLSFWQRLRIGRPKSQPMAMPKSLGRKK